MKSNYHQYEFLNGVLAYKQAGTGDRTLLTFHGFGQDHSAFNKLVVQLGERFTFYSFDLFFHGNSSWRSGDKPLSKEVWKAILSGFLEEKGIDKFNMLGFSLGGKFVLASLEVFHKRVESVYLLAPDGIKTNIWYSLATYPIALKGFFKSMISKPGRFKSMVALVGTLKLVDKGVVRFAETQMDTEEKRKRVYYSWVVFSDLKFDVEKIAQLINSTSIEFVLVIGKYDKIVTAQNMKALIRKAKNAQLEILDTGHNGLINKAAEVLRK